MTVKSNQLDVPFTPDLLAKLNSVTPGAQPQPTTATQAEALAGIDNIKMMTALRVAQAITALAGGGGGGGGGGNTNTTQQIESTFLNTLGFTLPEYTVVRQDSSGDLAIIDPSVQSHVDGILGVLTSNIANGAYGAVALDGIISNVSLPFNVNDIVWLSKSGSLQNVAPDIGVTSYVAGDYVVKIGRITRNPSNGSEIDLELDIELRGQL